jgi:S1-C subfamily serine protease
MNQKQTFVSLALAAATLVAGAYGYTRYSENKKEYITNSPSSSIFSSAKYTEGVSSGPEVDFEKAAAKASPAVVHIKTVMKGRQISVLPDMEDNPFKDFFGPGFGDKGNPGIVPKQKGSGSGVIINADGYIVTNNHVVDQASELTVTLNDKTDYKAKVIGTDPSSDLAVIKIDAHNLPFINFANSDELHLGQWVLAYRIPVESWHHRYQWYSECQIKEYRNQ